jgi:hypothetical protein
MLLVDNLFIFVVLEFELMAYTLSLHLVMEFFKIGSLELLAQADFEPKSS